MYEGFAHLYDALQKDVPYEKYADYYEAVLKKFGGEKGLCLDLGCGTGNMTRLLQKRGFDMIGVDASADMLAEAMERSEGILYLNQDMRAFELYGTVALVVSTLDCVNYVTEYEDLVGVFKLVNNYLDPKGLFIFDINSAYKLREIIGYNDYICDGDDIFYSWQNSFDEETKICTFYLTFFEKKGELYERFDEVHQERAYTTDEIKSALAEAGMDFIGAFDGCTFEDAAPRSERIFFVARERGKERGKEHD